MNIERYLHSGQGEPFGAIRDTSDSPQYVWYVGDGRVGIYTKIIKGKPAPFTYGFLTWGDALMVQRNGKSTELWRTCYPEGLLSEKNDGGPHVATLADLLGSHETVHVFETAIHDGGVASILTFSAQPPTQDNYRKITPMRVTIQ